MKKFATFESQDPNLFVDTLSQLQVDGWEVLSANAVGDVISNDTGYGSGLEISTDIKWCAVLVKETDDTDA